jgi:transposase
VIGKKTPQKGLFKSDNLYRGYVGEESFYAFLARSGSLFRDEDFVELYRYGGRPSVPPSQLCVALILQARENVSDHEAIERTAYDLRWKVALGLEIEEKLCAKSTLQEFRAKLILNDRFQAIFERSVEECRRSGLLALPKLEVAIDTTPIFGKGAVKDTFNLVADQIRRVVEEAVRLMDWNQDEVIEREGLSRYFAGSFKGGVELDWSSKDQQRALVGQLVGDANVTLELGKKALREHETGPATRALREAQALLANLLVQDIDPEPEDGGGPQIKKGTSPDRVLSTTDPDMRHGRKSSSNAFNGYKGSVVAETTSGVILATGVIPGNAHDGKGAAEQIRAAGQRAGTPVGRVLGDTAYGSANVRQKIAEVAEEIFAKAPPATNNGGRFTVDDFRIDQTTGVATCPAGRTTLPKRTKNRKGDPGWLYVFSPAHCSVCPLREKCTTASSRSLVVTEITKLNQAHRRAQRERGFLTTYRRRVLIEHRIARLVQLGIRKARFFGRLKVSFQLAMAATVANLALVAS